MKRKGTIFFLAVAFMFFGMIKVNASDLSSSITTNDGLGGVTNFTTSYDAENDITNLKAIITVDSSFIQTVLAQKPGNGATTSYFYMGITPHLGLTTMFKENYYYDVSTTKTVDQIKTEIKEKIEDPDDKSTNDTVWTIGLMIQYYDTTSNSWKLTNTAGNGVTSISDDLVAKLNLSSESELEYGVNFRFAMYENYNWYFVWTDANPNDENATVGVEEYVKVSYEINFPIQSSNDEESVYHITLKDALENGYKNILVQSDIEVTEDIVIPEGTTLTVAQGKTVKLIRSTLENNGTIINNGTITDGQNNYYTVSTQAENGTVSVDKNLVLSGEEISIITTANDGYTLKSIKVMNLDGISEITVDDGKFVMPEGNVQVIATFEKVDNPKTFDNIMIFVVIAMISVIASVFVVNKLRKRA